MKTAFLFWFFSLPFFLAAQTFTVETVPDPRKINNSHVSDPSSKLTSGAVDSINQILNQLEDKTTVQVAVVLLPSIGEADGFDFAQSLFTKWGIGRKNNDNGLLILFVADQHLIRFHTGLALEGVLTDIRCKQIQQKSMVPYFREGQVDEGMLQGIVKTSEFLLDPNAAEEITDTGDDLSGSDFFYLFISAFCGVGILITLVLMLVIGRFSTKPSVEPQLRMSWMLWVFLYLLVPVAALLYSFLYDIPVLQFLAFAGAFVLFCFIEKFARTAQMAARLDAPYAYHLLNNEISFWKFASFVFPFPALIGFLIFKKRKNDIRFGARKCKQCELPLTLQTEKTEDKYLQSGQIAEEKIKVTDYDVWYCEKCKAVETTGFPDFSNRGLYQICPSCQFLTLHSASSRTIKAATYDDEGVAEQNYKCFHCKFSKKERVVVARKIHYSTSDSSSSDFSSSSSGSSSDSGGSDWGGGSSGGGGASSTW
jgi:uncharacterized protein